MPEWLNRLVGEQLPRAALAYLAAKQGGPEAFAAFNQGAEAAALQRQALARQAQLDAQRQAEAEEERAFKLADLQMRMDAARRADEREDRLVSREDAAAKERDITSRRQRTLEALKYLDTFASGLGETATDPTAAENQLLGRAASLEGTFDLSQGSLSPMVPNMAPVISKRKQKLAEELYTRAEKLYGPQAMAEDAITIQTEAFGPVKPSQLRGLFAPTATTATGEPAKLAVPGSTQIPNTTEEQEIAEAIAAAEATKGAPLTYEERSAIRLKAIASIDAARRDPRQPAGGGSAITDPRAVGIFNNIVGNYQRSPLMRASDRTVSLQSAVAAARKDPTNPANQMALGYGFIQALDTYQSAVREGELSNLGTISGLWDRLRTQAERVAFNQGAFIPPEAVKQIATASEQLIAAIEQGKARKMQEFASQARVAGVGSMWNDYVSGFSTPTVPPPATGGGAPSATSPASTGAGATYQDYLRAKGKK